MRRSALQSLERFLAAAAGLQQRCAHQPIDLRIGFGAVRSGAQSVLCSIGLAASQIDLREELARRDVVLRCQQTRQRFFGLFERTLPQVRARQQQLRLYVIGIRTQGLLAFGDRCGGIVVQQRDARVQVARRRSLPRPLVE
jgi:hypothetical protein